MTFTYRGGMLGKYRSASVGRVRQYSTAVRAAIRVERNIRSLARVRAVPLGGGLTRPDTDS